MEDYNRVLDATTVSENANGTAAEKMTIYTQTLEAAQNNLTSSIQQFAQDSNLDQILIAAYNGLAKVVEILNILLNKIPVLSPLIKALGVALATAFAANMLNNLAKTSTGIGTIISTISSAIPNLQAFASLVGTEFVTAMTAAGGGLSGLISGFGAAATAATTLISPVTLVIAGLGALLVVIPKVVEWYDNLKNAKENALKESTQELEDANQNLEGTNSQIKEIQQKIDDINSKDGLTIADEAEKQRLQDQLDILKEIQKVQEDIVTSKAAENLQNTRDVIESKYSGGKTSGEYLSQLRANATGYGEQGLDPYASMYDAESASVQQLIANLKFLDEQKKNLNATDSDYQEKLDRINQLYSENNTQLLTQKQSLLQYKQSLIDAGDTGSDAFKLVTERLDEINIQLDPSNFKDVKIDELVDTSGLKGKLQKASNEAKNAMTKAASDTSIAVRQEAVNASKDLSKEIKDAAKKIAEQIRDDKELKSMFAEVFNIDPAEFDKNASEIEAVIEQRLTQAYGVAANAASNAESSVRNANGEIKTAAELADELGQRETNLATKTDALSNAYNAMIDKGKLTKSQMNALIKQYPELTSAIEVHNGVIRIETSVLQDKYDTVMQGEVAYYNAQIRETETVIQETKTRITAYENEANALRTLNRLQPTQKQQDFESAFPGVNFYGSMDNMPSLPGAGQNLRGKLYEQDQKDLEDLNAQLEIYKKNVEALSGQHLEYSGSGSSKSSKSAADKAAKEFENEIKDKVKNLKSIVQLYSENTNWDDPEVVKDFQTRYDKLLNEVINDPKARKVLADAFNLDISNMPVEQQIQELTTLWQKQAGTIQEEYQKLLKNKAKEDVKAAKAIVTEYEQGVYGAWSSDEALNAAKASYQKFIDKITNDADYRKAMAEALNIDNFDDLTVEQQIKAVTEALEKSTGKLDDAQQELYDKASKNIKALQDEIEDMIDTAIDLLQKAGDFLFDMLGKISDRYDAQIDNLDKISDKLDDQKDAFEDKIDQQKELLKLQKKEMDNADELAEKNKSIADIDAQLMELQYDNSAEAQAKRLKLLDERAQKEKDLADWQKDNDYDVKIDALDKEKSEYEKTIEAEKKAIEAQKQTLQDAQKQFKTTLSNIQNGFNTFIKILSSDLVKNLISKALINSGSDTVTNLLTGYNKIFGSGIDSDVTGVVKEGYKSLGEIGGKLSGDILSTEDGILGGVKKIGDAITDLFKNFTRSTGNAISVSEKGANGIISTAIKGIKSIFGASDGAVSKITTNGITSMNIFGSSGQGIISNLGNFAVKALQSVGNTTGGIVQMVFKGISQMVGGLGKGIGQIGGFLGKLFGIGGGAAATGAATTGVAGAATAGTGATIAGGAGLAGVAGTVGTGLVIGTGIASAVGGVVGYWKDTIGLWKDKDKNFGQKLGGTLLNFAKTMIPGYGLYRIGKALFGKHHTGSDYVKKQNPMLDKMLGLGNDETVSILKVGEAVVPTWANSASSSASNNRFTGSPFGNAVDSAVKSARASSRTSQTSGEQSISISIPINIQGDADASTVKALKEVRKDIVNDVMKTINNQTRIGGYRNIKAATV